MIHPDEYKKAWEQGEKQAEADIASGSPKYYWGFCGTWGERLVELFQDRFGITPISITDIRRQKDDVYEETYNRTIEAYVDNKFDKGAIRSTLDEVYAYREKIHEQYTGLGNRDKGTGNRGVS